MDLPPDIRPQYSRRPPSSIEGESESQPADPQREHKIKAQLIVSYLCPPHQPTIADHASTFLEVFVHSNRSFLRSILETTQGTEYDRVASGLVVLYEFLGDSPCLLQEAIALEVNKTSDPATQFRGNNLQAKILYYYARRVGERYLQSTIKPVVEKIVKSSDSFEIDPSRMRPTDVQETNLKLLLASLESFMKAIVQSVDVCPLEIKQLCTYLKEELSAKFPGYGNIAVAGFMFLRFFNPTIVTPEKMLPGITISVQARRNLVLISKVLQNLANGIEFGDKEIFMKPTNAFLSAHRDNMQRFLDQVSVLPEAAKMKLNRTYSITESPEGRRVSDLDLLVAVNHLYKQVWLDQKKVMMSLAERAKRTGDMDIVNSVDQLAKILLAVGDRPLFIETKAQILTEQEKLYLEYRSKAHKTDFSDIVSQGAIFLGGSDAQNRPVLVIIAERIKNIEFDKLFLYIIQVMDPIVSTDYVIVYVHASLDQLPSFNWMKNAWTVFNRKYKKNLKELYIVRPSRWVKFLAACFRPFVSGKFWKKVTYIDELRDLRNVTTLQRLALPPELDIWLPTWTSKPKS